MKISTELVADSIYESLVSLCSELVARATRSALGLSTDKDAEEAAAKSIIDDIGVGDPSKRSEESVDDSDELSASECDEAASDESFDVDEDARAPAAWRAEVKKVSDDAANATPVSKRVADLGSPKSLQGLAQPPKRKGSREGPGMAARRPADIAVDKPKARKSRLFSPSEWLATAASSAIEEPLARAVRVKVARRARFDVRCVRTSRAAESLGYRGVSLLCLSAAEDKVTPSSHARTLLARHAAGRDARRDDDAKGDRRRRDDRPPATAAIVMCAGDHNAPRPLHAQLSVLKFLATHLLRWDEGAADALALALRRNHSGAGLRAPPWIFNHKRRSPAKPPRPPLKPAKTPPRGKPPPSPPAAKDAPARLDLPPPAPPTPTTPVQYGAHSVDFDIPDEDHERPASPSDPRRRPIAAEEDVVPPNTFRALDVPDY